MGSAWDFPTSLNVGGIDYEIRTDYRAVLDVLTALNDPDLTDADDTMTAYMQSQVIMQIMFPNYEEKSINQIKKQLEKFNRIDSKSDFYRYPISKDNKQSKLKIWDKFDSDSLINVNFKNTYVMCNQDNEILYILKNIDIQSLKYLNILHNNCFYFLEQLSKMVK